MEIVAKAPQRKAHAAAIIAAAIAVMAWSAPRAQAEAAFNWGTPVFSSLFDSYGNPLDASYTFELGAFDPSFTPTSNNVTSWSDNWKIFDTATFNVEAEHFASTANMLDDGTSTSATATAGYDFRGLDAYIWGYNTKSYILTLEWVWLRSTNWTFPTSITPGPPVTPTEWSISDLTPSDVPLWGRQSNSIGLGYATNPGTYNLQTYTLNVPEPSTVALLCLAGAGTLLAARLRRR